MKATRPTPLTLLTFTLALAGLAADSQAQLGSGWVAYSPTVRIHLDGDTGDQTTYAWKPYQSNCTPTICADYRYDSATDTEIFRLLDSRSNRSEIRVNNDYSTGKRQFQGYLTFSAPLDDESLMQIFGNSSGGATYAMVRGYAANGGEIRVMSPAAVIASGVYGREVRINVIHVQNQFAKFYVNGSLKLTKGESDTAATNYHKYGCYGTLRTGAVTVKWRQVRHFRDGNPPGTTTPTPTPAPSASRFEAELLTVTASSGDTRTINSETGASGGQYVMYQSNAVGDWLRFRIPNLSAGTYAVTLGYKRYTTRGIVQMAVGNEGGTLSSLGAPLNMNGTSAFVSAAIGTWTTASTGNKSVELRITGTTGSGYTMAVDYITLTRQ